MRSVLLISPFILVTAGCSCNGGAGCPDSDNLVAEVSPDIPTVVTVSWTTEEPSTSYVAFGPGEDLSLQTALEPEATTEHVHYLLGVPANTDGSYEVVTVDADGNECADSPGTFTTGGLASGLPSLDVTGSGMDEYMVLPMLGSPVGLVILDPDGNFLWWHFEDRGLDVYRALLSVDGESLLYNAASVSGDPADDSQIMRVSLDGSTVEGLLLFIGREDPNWLADWADVITNRVRRLEAPISYDGAKQQLDTLLESVPRGEALSRWSAEERHRFLARLADEADEQPEDWPLEDPKRIVLSFRVEDP